MALAVMEIVPCAKLSPGGGRFCTHETEDSMGTTLVSVVEFDGRAEGPQQRLGGRLLRDSGFGHSREPGNEIVNPGAFAAVLGQDNWLAVARVVSAIRSLAPYPDQAAAFHHRAEQAIKRWGWPVKREVRVALDRAGRGGRVDLVALVGSRVVAIECDRITPRIKSLQKLRKLDCDARLILLRGELPMTLIRNVAVLGVAVTS
jgi:hypothetical protein